MSDETEYGRTWFHDLSFLSVSQRRHDGGISGCVAYRPPPCCVSASVSGYSCTTELLPSHTDAEVGKNHDVTHLRHPVEVSFLYPVSTTTEHGAQPFLSGPLEDTRTTSGGDKSSGIPRPGFLSYDAGSRGLGSEVDTGAAAAPMTRDEVLYGGHGEFLGPERGESEGVVDSKESPREASLRGAHVAHESDTATAIRPCAAESSAREYDVGKLFERALMVARCRPEGERVSPASLVATLGPHDEGWSDIVLTRGCDTDALVLSARPDTMKQANETNDICVLGNAPKTRQARNLEQDPKTQSGVPRKCAVLQPCGPGDPVTFESRRMDRVAGEGPGRMVRTGGNSSLPARLMRHIWRRMRAYEQRKTNRRHLVVVATSFLIGVTLAVLLICIAHALMDSSVVKEQTFLS